MGGLLTKFKSYNVCEEIPDLSGRVAIVTGANSGVGLYTVLHLARRGAKVYLGARNETKAKAAIEKLRTEGLGDHAGEIVWLDVDLSNPQRAKHAAEWFLAKEDRLDILINNAGMLLSFGEYKHNPNCISENVVVNHLSPFHFTNTLVPLLTATAQKPGTDVRIVNVSSNSYHWALKPTYDAVEALNPDLSSVPKPNHALYGYSKLANVLYAKELQRRFDADSVPIINTSLHPGSVMSDGVVGIISSMFSYPRFFIWLGSLYLLNSEQGAYTSVFASASPVVRAEADLYKGAYLEPFGKVVPTTQDANDPDLAKRLWETSQYIIDNWNQAGRAS